MQELGRQQAGAKTVAASCLLVHNQTQPIRSPVFVVKTNLEVSNERQGGRKQTWSVAYGESIFGVMKKHLQKG